LSRRFSLRVRGTNTPVVTLSIMGVCVFVYLLQVIPVKSASNRIFLVHVDGHIKEKRNAALKKFLIHQFRS